MTSSTSTSSDAGFLYLMAGGLIDTLFKALAAAGRVLVCFGSPHRLPSSASCETLRSEGLPCVQPGAQPVLSVADAAHRAAQRRLTTLRVKPMGPA